MRFSRHAIFAACLLSGCAGEPRPARAPASDRPLTPPEQVAAVSTASKQVEATPTKVEPERTADPASASESTVASEPPQQAEPAPPPEPPLLDAEGKPLPQTDELPSADDAAFEHRMRLLVQAIAEDDPALAGPAFFPVIAYEQVKAIAKPARDWETRLMRAFERDIHDYHRALGDGAEAIRLAGVEIPQDSVRWMKPHSEGNLIGYHRVLRSKLNVVRSNGEQHSFGITSMISWRGQWYVVHLHGFK